MVNELNTIEQFKENYNNDKVCDFIERLEVHAGFSVDEIEVIKEYLITKNSEKPILTQEQAEFIERVLESLI